MKVDRSAQKDGYTQTKRSARQLLVMGSDLLSRSSHSSCSTSFVRTIHAPNVSKGVVGRATLDALRVQSPLKLQEQI